MNKVEMGNHMLIIPDFDGACNPKPPGETLNREHETCHFEPSTENTRPRTLNPKPRNILLNRETEGLPKLGGILVGQQKKDYGIWGL